MKRYGVILELECLEARIVPEATLSLITVNTNSDIDVQQDGQISLREAIRLANGDLNLNALDVNEKKQITGIPAANQFDGITFHLGNGLQVIRPDASDLPAVTDRVVISGAAPGELPNQKIQLDGQDKRQNGLQLLSHRCSISALNIIRFLGAGIRIENGAENQITGNIIGLDMDGQKKANARGIWLDSLSTENRIGGSLVEHRNVISGNAVGILIAGRLNSVIGNYIGTSSDGVAANVGNRDGIWLSEGHSNKIGIAGEPRNIVSDNTQYGILVEGAGLQGGKGENKVANNYIGLDKNGNGAGNAKDGVRISFSNGNVIGGLAILDDEGTLIEGANVISDNGSHGVRIISSSETQVKGNFIGTNASGEGSAGGNGNDVGNGGGGVRIEVLYIENNLAGFSRDNEVGGEWDEERNVISNNSNYGVMLTTKATSGNWIWNNFIGTKGSGALATGAGLPNHGPGIRLHDSTPNNTIWWNSVSHNDADGILLSAPGPGNFVEDNFLVRNKLAGARLDGASGVRLARNQVWGNGGNGFHIAGGNDVQVDQNLIGTDGTLASGMGNLGAGALAEGDCQDISFTGNSLYYNANQGVAVLAAKNVSLTGNTIKQNPGAGVLFASGVSGSLGVYTNVISENEGYGVSVETANLVAISSNTISSNQASGVRLAAGSSHSLQNNTISKNQGDGVTRLVSGNLVFSSNIVTQNTGNAISPLSGGNYTIAGNTVQGNSGYGFAINSGTATFSDNVTTGNAVKDLLFAGGTSSIDGLLNAADYVLQTGGTASVLGTQVVHELFKLEGGSLQGASGSILSAKKVHQSGGQHGANQAQLYVQEDYQVDGGNTTFAGTGTLQVAGNLKVYGGTVTLNWNLTVMGDALIFQGGVFEALANSVIHGDIVNQGLLSLGYANNPGAAGAVFTIDGNFTQSASGILRLRLGQYSDKLIINGSAALNGTLDVGLEEGYTPSGPDYEVITWGSRSGTFANISLPALSPPFSWDVEYGALGLTLVVEMEM